MADQNAAGSDSDVDSDVVPISGEGVPRPPTRNSRINRRDFKHLVETSHTISGSRNLCCALSLLGPDASIEMIIGLYHALRRSIYSQAMTTVRRLERGSRANNASLALLALTVCSPVPSVAWRLATLMLRQRRRLAVASKQGGA